MLRPTRSLPLALLTLLGWSGAAEAQARRPGNVVVIIADDHGQDTRAYGNPIIRTPNLDRLAGEGTLFTHAFATTASCSASRSVVLTGLHNHRTGQYGHEHAIHHFRSFENLKSLPVLLADAGYRTARIGKYHVGPESVYHFQQVFTADERNPVEMAETVKPFLQANRNRPFFLYFATSDPHRSGDPSVAQAAAAAPAQEGIVPDGFGNRPQGYAGITEVEYSPDEVLVPAWLPDNRATREELAEYYQSVSRVDQGVGRLVQLLREAGVYDNTLIVYMSDHGAAFAGAKTTHYEPGLRAPLIVRHPAAARRGVRTNAMVSWVDITPTIVDFAGAREPSYPQIVELAEVRRQLPERHGFHGRSFLPVLEQEEPAGWDEVFGSHTFHELTMYYPMRTVRGRQYKLIWNVAPGLAFPFASDLWSSAAWQSVYQQGGMDARYGVRTAREYVRRPEWELYDVQHDPWESRNLAGDPRYAGVLDQLRGRIQDFQRRTSDPWLVEWTRP